LDRIQYSLPRHMEQAHEEQHHCRLLCQLGSNQLFVQDYSVRRPAILQLPDSVWYEDPWIAPFQAEPLWDSNFVDSMTNKSKECSMIRRKPQIEAEMYWKGGFTELQDNRQTGNIVGR
jgi:hypothetical protein